MDRSADYTIQGFLYQFNKMLLEVLSSVDGEEVAIEGPIEDVEVTGVAGTKAIQCKYHETKETFSLSSIYKPLLQMMVHFHENPGAGVSYVLYAHFPGQTGIKTLAKTELIEALATKNKSLKKYCNLLRSFEAHDAFLNSFKLEFGPSFEDLVKEVYERLAEAGFAAADIEILSYPNALHFIALLSIRHDVSERKITKARLVGELRKIKITAISRWTLSLRTKKQLLTARKNQLKHHFDKNTRRRHLLLDGVSIDNFEADAVGFITDFVEKYHFKPSHIHPPLFCLDVSDHVFNEIQLGLYKKGIVAEDGYIAGHFEEEKFLRDPMQANRGKQKEFRIRLAKWQSHGFVLQKGNPDDVFVLGTKSYSILSCPDASLELIGSTSFREISYIMGFSNAYE